MKNGVHDIFDENNFNRNYFENYGGTGYILGHFVNTQVKKTLKVIRYIDNHIETILDIGCAMGYNVQLLRKLGYQAHGFDISSYAVDLCNPEVKEYLWIGNIFELNIPQNTPGCFDLITCFEVMEHIDKTLTRKALNIIRELGQFFYFTMPTPTYNAIHGDKTHINLQLPDWWYKQFEECGYERIYKKMRYVFRRVEEW